MIGTLSFGIPTFASSGLRSLVPPSLGALFISILLDKKNRFRIRVLLDSFSGLAASVFLLLLVISPYLTPASYSKIFTTLSVSVFCYFAGFFTGLRSEKDKSEKVLIFTLCISGLLVSLVSLTILIGGNLGLDLIGQLTEEGNFRYILYDLGRGRVYPIFPSAYFIGVITYVSLTEMKAGRHRYLWLLLLVLGTIALYASNYRILSLVGSLSLIYSAVLALSTKWWRIFPLVILIGIIPAILLPTNLLRRSFLVETTDRRTIEGRLEMVNKYFNLALDNNFQAVGLGNATEREDLEVENQAGVFPANQNPHNIYLQLLVEGGLPLVVSYLVFIGILFVQDVRLLVAKDTPPLFKVISLTCLLFFVASAIERHAFNSFAYIFSLQGLLTARSENGLVL